MSGAIAKPSAPADAMTLFPTVLSWRSREDRRPSELEIHLKEHCQRLKVVSNLSGAHFVFRKW